MYSTYYQPQYEPYYYDDPPYYPPSKDIYPAQSHYYPSQSQQYPPPTQYYQPQSQFYPPQQSSSYFQPQSRYSYHQPSTQPYFADGMISDIEYLNFIDEGEFKKYRLKTRILNDDGSHIHQAEHNNRRSLTSTSDKFFLGLIENMKIEKQIDNLRVRLCQQDDFNIPSLFELFDKESRGYLTEQTFERWFLENKTVLPHDCFALIYKRFAQASQKGTIQFKNFQRIFLPFGGTGNRDCMNPNNFQILGSNTLSIIHNLMNLYKEQEMFFETLRKRLKLENFNYREVFQEIDTNRNDSIGLNEFGNALRRYNHHIDDLDVILVFSRFDKDGNGVLSLMEFQFELLPKS